MRLEPDLEEILRIDEIISSFSEEELLKIGHRLNRYEWPEELGSAPEGFDGMCLEAKHFCIEPWVRTIDLHTSEKARRRYWNIHERGWSAEQFEDWWQSEMYTMLKNMDDCTIRPVEPKRSANTAAIIISIAAMAISLAVTAMR